jgi:hypothetical protein
MSLRVDTAIKPRQALSLNCSELLRTGSGFEAFHLSFRPGKAFSNGGIGWVHSDEVLEVESGSGSLLRKLVSFKQCWFDAKAKTFIEEFNESVQAMPLTFCFEARPFFLTGLRLLAPSFFFGMVVLCFVLGLGPAQVTACAGWLAPPGQSG